MCIRDRKKDNKTEEKKDDQKKEEKVATDGIIKTNLYVLNNDGEVLYSADEKTGIIKSGLPIICLLYTSLVNQVMLHLHLRQWVMGLQ